MSRPALWATIASVMLLASVPAYARPASPSPVDPHETEIRARDARIRALEERVEQLEEEVRGKGPPTQTPNSTPTNIPTAPAPTTASAAPEAVQQQNSAKQCDLLTARAPDAVIADPKGFSEACLKPWKTYDSEGLGVALVGSSDGSVAEITPTYTTRWRRPTPDGYIANYLRFKVGVSAPLDSDKKAATFADLSTFERSSGVAAIFGVEWGNGRPVTRAQVATALAQIQADCVADQLTTPAANTFEQQALGIRSRDQVAANCQGERLDQWMSNKSRVDKYYDSIIRPLFADYRKSKDVVPAFWFGGFEGRLARSTYSFVPLVDPENTGIPLLTQLPPNFPGGDTKVPHHLYSFKAYFGRGTGGHLPIFGANLLKAGDFSLSMTYRRDFAFPKNTDQQQVCAPQDSAILCYKKNIAPPFELKGFVAGARAAFLFSQLSLIPSTAIELKGTYDFALRRWGAQVPVYFVAGDSGKPSGGILLSCTSAGHTDSGIKFDKDCRAAIFVGTEFRLDNR